MTRSRTAHRTYLRITARGATLRAGVRVTLQRSRGEVWHTAEAHRVTNRGVSRFTTSVRRTGTVRLRVRTVAPSSPSLVSRAIVLRFSR